MACDKEVLEATIKEIARRADLLHLAYSHEDIVPFEDHDFTLIMLKNYFDFNDPTTFRSALELYYVAPEAFNNPDNCNDIMLRKILEQGYDKDEVIPYLRVVIRVVMRCAELFAIISDENEVMFGDDTNTDVFQQYLKFKVIK